MSKAIAAILRVCMLIGICGCGQKKQEVVEKRNEALAEKIMERALKSSGGEQADVDISSGTIRITSKEGSMVVSSGADAELPASLPDDVPIYKGAGIVQSMDRGEQGFSLMLKSSDEVKKVVAFYKTTLESNGWTQESAMDMGADRAILSYTKEKRGLHLVIVGAEGDTHITIAASSEE